MITNDEIYRLLQEVIKENRETQKIVKENNEALKKFANSYIGNFLTNTKEMLVKIAELSENGKEQQAYQLFKSLNLKIDKDLLKCSITSSEADHIIKEIEDGLSIVGNAVYETAANIHKGIGGVQENIGKVLISVNRVNRTSVESSIQEVIERLDRLDNKVYGIDNRLKTMSNRISG